MGVGVQQAAVKQHEQEVFEHLPPKGLARLGRPVLHLAYCLAVFPDRREHTRPAEFVDDLRDRDIQFATGVGIRPLVLGLANIVQLFIEGITDGPPVVGQIEPTAKAADRLAEPAQHLEIGLDRFANARVLNLDRNHTSIAQRGPMHLAQRCGQTVRVDVAKHRLGFAFPLLGHDRQQGLQGDRFRRVRQRGKGVRRLLVLAHAENLAHLLGQTAQPTESLNEVQARVVPHDFIGAAAQFQSMEPGSPQIRGSAQG